MIRLLLLLAGLAYANVVVPYGGTTKSLFPTLCLKNEACVTSGTADPSVSGFSAVKGSLYIRSGASGGTAYLKTDDGLSTNWSPLYQGAADEGLYSTTRHVDQIRGLDTNDGGVTRPFKTIQAALNSIGNAANNAEYTTDATSRYLIDVSPGVYVENITLPTRRHVELKLNGSLITGDVTMAPADMNAGSLFVQKFVVNGGDLRSSYEGIGQSVTGISGNIYVQPVVGTNFRPQIHIIDSGVTGNIEFTNGIGSYQGFVFLENALVIGKVISNNAGLLVTLYVANSDTSSSKSFGGATGDVLLNVLRNVRMVGVVDVTADGSALRWFNTDFGTGIAHDFTGSVLTNVYADANSVGSFLSGVPGGSQGSVTWNLADKAIGVAFTPAGGIAATTAQAAIEELDTEKEPLVSAGTSSQYYRGDKTWQALTATACVNTPSGNLAAATVQAALNELQTDIDGREPTITTLATTKGGTGLASYSLGDLLYASATNVLARLGIGSPHQVLKISPTTGLPYWADATDPTYCYNALEEDFVLPSGSAGRFQISGTVSGGSATNSAGVQGHMGIVTYSTGTGTTGNAAAFVNGGFAPFRFDSAAFVAEWIDNIPVLSDATNTFGVALGLSDLDVGVPVPVQATASGAFFRYTHGTNSGKWQAATANNGTANTTFYDTGITAETTLYHRFTIKNVQSGGNTSVTFYIDGVLVATSSANVPTTRTFNMNWRINKSAGGTARTHILDAVSLNYCYGVAR